MNIHAARDYIVPAGVSDALSQTEIAQRFADIDEGGRISSRPSLQLQVQSTMPWWNVDEWKDMDAVDDVRNTRVMRR
jgi:hypothetical protein